MITALEFQINQNLASARKSQGKSESSTAITTTREQGEMKKSLASTPNAKTISGFSKRHEKIILRMYEVFGRIYGGTFRSLYGDTPDFVYVACLSQINSDSLIAAIKKIVEGKSRFDQFPPNPLEILKLAQSVAHKHPDLPMNNFPPSGPIGEQSEVGTAALQELKQILK